MKKLFSIIVIAVICAISTSGSGQMYEASETLDDEWSGSLRIEAKESTIWSGIVTVSETYFDAKNVDTNETEQFYISYPSALGALVEAANLGSFSYELEYWPSWDAILITTIGDDSDWWHYWVDFELPMVGADSYELTEEDNDILFGYLESWYAHALKIEVDKSNVKKDEEFTVYVFDEADNSVDNATVHIDSEAYTTDSEGSVKIKLTNKGKYSIYSEKDGYVRSEKESIQVNQ
jgi:hypothetical protein